MDEILNKFLYGIPGDAEAVLEEYGMKQRNEMAALAQKFADWMALQNSRAING